MAGNLPKPPLPTRKRIFAHVLMVDLSCPHCGRVHAATSRASSRRLKVRKPRQLNQGYDYIRGLFTCRQCQRQYLLGVILYPLGAGGRLRKPMDTRPTLAEAVELREQGSWVAQNPLGGPPGASQANWEGAEVAGRGDRVPAGPPAGKDGLVAKYLSGEDPE